MFIATDSRNERYVVDEIWSHGDGKWLAEEIVRRVQRSSYRVGRVIIDPLAKGDSNNDNTTFDIIAEILMRYDMVLEVASKDKDAGILQIQDHLCGPNNMPSLFFFDHCFRTIYEAEGWMWDPKEPDKATKKDDHMMENLYRLLLLKTKWTQPFDYSEYSHSTHATGRDMVTGY